MNVDLDAEKARLREIHTKTRVSNTTNIDSEMGYIDEETFLIPPSSKPIVGRDAVRTFVEETINTKVTSMGDPRKGHSDFWISSSGDLAINRGHYKVKKESLAKEEGYYITIYRKLDGEWKLLGEMWNILPE
jgi:ketosteroid isomerase-like protein